jgi:predicted AAA+ superfamily ATPase
MTKAQDLTKAFDDFMKWGGLPGRFIFDNETETQKYLTSVYDSIVLRDIVSRANVRDINLLDNIFKFLIDNTGNFFSASKITAYLKSTSRSVSAETLYSYIHHIVSSMLVCQCSRFDIRGKQVLATREKYYAADMGILQLKKSNEAKNYGSRFETVVFNELIVRGYKIYSGMLRGGEIDFVAQKNGEKTYIQAAYELDVDETIQREYGAFKMISAEPGEKLLITNETNDYSRNGVKQINIIDWLLEKS